MDPVAAFNSQVPPAQQQTWVAQYGQAAPWIWAQQSGLIPTPGAGAQGFNALPYSEQATWYGTFGAGAPDIWAQQAAAAGAAQPAAPAAPTAPRAGTPQPSTWNPAGDGRGTGWGSISAGTQWTAPGWGVPGFGQAAIPIQPSYLDYLKTAPGYIPGSGTYNQFRLDQPGLVNQINGITYNQQYGSGGVGDPGSGANNNLTSWQQGDRLFNWPGANLEDQYSPIGNMFLRSDTSSGLGTTPLQNQWMAPLLLQAMKAGRITPTDRGKQFLQQVMGISPDQYGNAGGGRIAGTTTNPASGGAGGAGGTDSAYQQYLNTITANAQAMQAAQLAYQDWMMRTKDDELAFSKATEAYNQKWGETMERHRQEEAAGYMTLDGNRVPTLAGTLQEANLTGMYNGQPTFAREQYQTNEMNSLLSLAAGLRGPANYAQYLKVLGQVPEGMRDVVNAAAGRFQIPSTSGVTGAPTQAADVQSLLKDVTSGAAGQQQAWTQALSGGLPAPNQINTLNWSRMLPSAQQMLLGAYESQGFDPNDVQKMIQQASPASMAGPTSGALRF